MRNPRASSERSTSASALGQGGATEIGESRLKPTIASSMSAASSTVRANGPCTWPGSHRSGDG
jgi:hypothetical protein